MELMAKFFSWIMEFFYKTSEKQTVIEAKIKEDKKKLKEIEDEEISDDDLDSYLN